MNHTKFTLRKNTKGLIFHTPTINLSTTQEQITALPNFKSQLKAYYKRFYKLRNFECTSSLYKVEGSPYHTPTITSDDYVTLLKRQFKHSNYNLKREKILHLPPLSNDEIVSRISNTLAFVFNHTTSTKNPQMEKYILSEQDEIDASIDTTESRVISTILRMDYDCPPLIKYDYKFNWIDEINSILAEYEDNTAVEKGDGQKGKKLKNQKSIPLELLTYKQYHTTLMRMDESLKLCF
ncbi:hypothetical protein KGF54_000523 [Candida jiufengensis]|uniref:uncharacterized protein n=1 Tax=Candida jiufengensis TaxID=497108 RepID=UPI002224FA95|nr:uncharacterized protein KGF54_000523 [Candida jiufengensis]KAI5956904.1 hypothetical protein KGF54_000523 [Candida jiufengensis]